MNHGILLPELIFNGANSFRDGILTVESEQRVTLRNIICGGQNSCRNGSININLTGINNRAVIDLTCGAAQSCRG